LGVVRRLRFDAVSLRKNKRGQRGAAGDQQAGSARPAELAAEDLVAQGCSRGPLPGRAVGQSFLQARRPIV
jgi:hypothetical protein